MKSKCLLFAFLWVLISCQADQKENQEPQSSVASTTFKLLDSKTSGITFVNELKEDSVVNYFTYPYIYMGGGVAIGDVNNDGLSDIYFTANRVGNELYLNKGDLNFENISIPSKTTSDDRWVTGATMVDINQDGLLDIYVSTSGKWTTKKNQLFVNQGINADGIPTFEEEAEKRGIADEGNSTQGNFFDYDNDGDLDLLVLNYPMTGFKTPNYSYRLFMDEKAPEKSDHLYRNDGNGFFTDVTEEAGLLNFGLALSAAIADYNNDGWDDIYISNDFASPDFLLMNNQDGTFTEKIKESTKHTSFFGMGTDAADINNDGLVDLFQLDMSPEDNRRNKANMASMNIPGFWEMVDLGFHYQYMQNVLQLNKGVDENGNPVFGDIARLAGVALTDWSWAPLIADFDNDGWKDIFVSNGTRKDINNKDYFESIEKADYNTKKNFTDLELSKNIPSEKVDNYIFKNNGDLSFNKVNAQWGLEYKGYTNGAAYADLDNDGDLDLVLNNIDEESVIFENKTSVKNNFIRIQLKGPATNPSGIGAKVKITSDLGSQFQQLFLSRGFQSSVDPSLHFGLGNAEGIESIEVTWPDQKVTTIQKPKLNQILQVEYSSQHEIVNKQVDENPTFKKLPSSLINFQHKENQFNDFGKQILIPHKYSQNGPMLAKTDLNADGLEDFFVGGAAGQCGQIFLQLSNGTFNKINFPCEFNEQIQEDMGALFFDADGDGDQDLYVVSGGNEYSDQNKMYQDRLYLNQQNEKFVLHGDALPPLTASGSAVRALDFDMDGDLDLIVTGRLKAQSYPLPTDSYLLENITTEKSGPKFQIVNDQLAPMLNNIGMISDVVVTDFNNDQRPDLVLVGEWTNIIFLQNQKSGFKDVSKKQGLKNMTGWWYAIHADDLDGDGDEDLVVGNLGENYKYQTSEEEPFDVYAYDFDRNGKLDIVLGYYNEGVKYPLRGRQCSSEQIPAIKYKFTNYNSFASASLEEVYTKEDLAKALHYQVETFSSFVLENTGNGFTKHELPNEAQISNINAIVSHDVNTDGKMDLILAGNMYGAEIETTRNDASNGIVLLGDNQFNFTPLSMAKSGINLNGDTKDLMLLKNQKEPLLICANNNDSLQVFQKIK